MAVNLYKGISTKNYLKNNSLSLNDLELVKEDILNHIWTRKGERVYMPNFGTSIPDLVFEPLDNITVDLIKEELLTVIKHDPRVDLINLNVKPYYPKNTVIAKIDLYFIELDVSDGLSLNIELGKG
jgi:phage baseplate assembly protein W